ncbi:hypothetical protein R5R35_013502 [Gryllus longicercus]|uniref:Roadblock/LAMTOR2 domain-containing protein n=1 Tax=Gryllus longicercus TaxID=2509291 RepID=A0AAN9V5Z2_9ORTH
MNPPLITTNKKKILQMVPQPAEEVLLRIESCQGVMGSLVSNVEGLVLRHTMETSLADKSAPLLRELSEVARHMVRDLNPFNDLCYLRVETSKYEIMVAPEPEYLMVVWQEPFTLGT